MAYDEGLAERIRGILSEHRAISEKRMFGGVAFMVESRMFVGIVKEDLMVRVGPEAHDALVRAPHARVMDFTGRPMRGFLFVAPPGYEADADLERWVERSLSFVTAMPKQRARKPPVGKKKSKKARAK
jgi:TfoX/Sxy family transcriptional regulator of competence genes